MATITRGLGFLPLSLSILLVFAMIVSYLIACLEHDVEPVLPSVSKTAAFQPQGSIFNQFLDTIAFVGLITVFLRFLQVEMATRGAKESSQTGLISRLRIASLTFGIGSMIGVTIAGNFRFPSGEEHGALGIVHFTGSLILGLGGIVYCFLETAITYQLTKLSINSCRMWVIRLLITCVLTASGIAHVVLKVWTNDHLSHDGNPLAKTPWRVYNATDDYYPEHVTSNFGEWLTFFLFAVFSSTYFKEFQKVSVNFSCFPKENREQSADDNYSIVNSRLSYTD
ncbi:DNA damage-regulated autophagy modulator protein 2-like [Oculina patagonica]